MLSSYLALQNAVLMNNMAQMSMLQSSDRLLNSAVRFGNSQPLKPSFSASLIQDELNIKANETKVTIAQHLIKALEKSLAKDIEKSTPKFAGLDYKA